MVHLLAFANDTVDNEHASSHDSQRGLVPSAPQGNCNERDLGVCNFVPIEASQFFKCLVPGVPPMMHMHS